MLFREGANRLPHKLPYSRKSVEGTDHKVGGKEKQESDKPPRMIHVRESEFVKHAVYWRRCPFTEHRCKNLQILLGLGILFDDGADDRSKRDCRKNNHRKLYGSEE